MPLEKKFDTLSSYIARALYGKNGYYTNSAQFQTEDQFGDFSTLATQGQGLAFILANYMHLAYAEQCSSGKRSDKLSPFIAVELSGGNGQLAYKILTFIQHLADKKFKQFPALWNSLQYTTYEISTNLTKIQEDLNKKFITTKKYRVKNKSALDIEKTQIDFCFSNEFWDSFPVDCFKKDSIGNFFVKVCVPYVPHKWIEQLLAKEVIDRNYKENIAELSQTNELKKVTGLIPIDKPTFEKIEKKYNEENWLKFLEKIKWETYWVPATLYPSTLQIINTQSYFKELDPEVEHHIALDFIQMGNRLAELNPYLNMHFDYGSAAKGGIRSNLRVYTAKADSDAHLDFNFQSDVDITTNVDFRLLGLLLSDGNLSRCFLGYNSLACLIYPDLLESARELGFSLTKDMNIFCREAPRSQFKFLACSTFLNFQQLNKETLYIGCNAKEDYPEKPLNPISHGIPLDRTYKTEPDHPNYPLTPLADIERLTKFEAIFCAELLGMQPLHKLITDQIFHLGRIQFNQLSGKQVLIQPKSASPTISKKTESDNAVQNSCLPSLKHP